MDFGAGEVIELAKLVWKLVDESRNARGKMNQAQTMVGGIQDELEMLQPEIKKYSANNKTKAPPKL